MMNNRGKLWVDITNIWYWCGEFTGIQTVVDQYTARFLKLKSAKLFIYVKEEGLYKEISYEEWIYKRNNIINGVIDILVPETRTLLRDLAQHHAAVTIKRTLPKSIKRPLRKKIDQYKIKSTEIKPLHPFKKGDSILIIAGNWGDDFHGFIEKLSSIKKTLNINLYHVIYDLIPLKYPNYFVGVDSFVHYIKIASYTVDGYLTISESTKKDLMSYLNTQKIITPIKVFRLGEDFKHVTAPEKPLIKINKNFILCVGTIEARKNHAILYNVVKLATQKGLEIPQIIIIGRVGWMAQETLRNITVDPDVKNKIMVLNEVTDNQKLWFFKNCLFTIYPSFYEGWGLPIVESLFNGKLCLCSNTSSMPEAGENYAEYFSPYDAREILNKILIYTNKENLEKKEREISKRRPIEWDESYKNFVLALREMSYNINNKISK